MIDKKETRSALKGLKQLKKELEKEKKRLSGSMKTMRKHVRAGTLPDWTEDAMKLYRSPDYSFFRMLKLMRKNKVL